MERRMKRKRVLVLSMAAIIFSLVGIFRVLRLSSVQYRDITSYIKRFDEVKEHLGGLKLVGYVYRGDFNVMNYYLAQYALAPLVLVNNPNLPLNIGNFGRRTHRFIKKSIQPKYKVVKNFGNGVFLLRRKKE
jgi:hypothetical protein